MSRFYVAAFLKTKVQLVTVHNLMCLVINLEKIISKKSQISQKLSVKGFHLSEMKNRHCILRCPTGYYHVLQENEI